MKIFYFKNRGSYHGREYHVRAVNWSTVPFRPPPPRNRRICRTFVVRISSFLVKTHLCITLWYSISGTTNKSNNGTDNLLFIQAMVLTTCCLFAQWHWQPTACLRHYFCSELQRAGWRILNTAVFRIACNIVNRCSLDWCCNKKYIFILFRIRVQPFSCLYATIRFKPMSLANQCSGQERSVSKKTTVYSDAMRDFSLNNKHCPCVFQNSMKNFFICA